MRHQRKKENAYQKMIERHQDELDAFPTIYAYNETHVMEIMEKRRLTPRPVYSEAHVGKMMKRWGLKFRRSAALRFFSGNHYYLRSDVPSLHGMLQRHITERKNAMDGDRTGEGFIADMLAYELARHPHSRTDDLLTALTAFMKSGASHNARLWTGLGKTIEAISKGG